MVPVRTVGLVVVMVVLAGTVGFALRREMTRESVPMPVTVATPEPLALSPEEEAYAEALWAIHSPTKVSAVNLSFTGLQYKTETHDRQRLAVKALMLRDQFAAAEQRVRDLTVPASLRPVHERYLGALDLYRAAATEMLRTAEDGDDAHLIDGQAMAQQASEDVLRIGDALWPGEYKPN